MGINGLLFGSFHNGGANFVFVDGSGHFLSDNIDLDLYEALASKNGDDVESLERPAPQAAPEQVCAFRWFDFGIQPF